MLTRLKIKNFKRLDDIEFELGKSVVLIGPNNSGKTTALQALALWDMGVKHWNEKRKTSKATKRTGVSINRNDLFSAPTPDARLLWRDLHVREGTTEKTTQNIRIDIIVEGVSQDKLWSCGLEFDYTNSESFVCRPLRRNGYNQTKIEEVDFTQIPEQTSEVRIAFLPPMSGLVAREFRKERGEINVMIGEGQTAQVLRNICYQLYEKSADKEWGFLAQHMRNLFGVTISHPIYASERSEIRMTYREGKGPELDLSSSGRGFQQVLLLLSHLYTNPGCTLLLDEPDAHLEVLRQREIYKIINQVAEEQGSQIIAASHSEIILNEAADKDIVIAFVGKPHRIDDRGSQVLKSLKDIGFDQYYLAEQTGWVLYMEGATDLAILQAFAKNLEHPAAKYLDRPFVHYTGNQPQKARVHFHGLLEAYPKLVGFALFDRLDRNLEQHPQLKEMMWQKKELENYLCTEHVLLAYAHYDMNKDDLFGYAEANRREQAMRAAIDEVSHALQTLRKTSPWSPDIKVTDDFLDPLFDNYFKKLDLPNLLQKTDYYILASYVPKDKIDLEIVEKLDSLVSMAKKAKPKL